MDTTSLNPQQRAAVEAPHDANVCILSGAGTGKTRALTLRVAAMAAAGTIPERICAVTFTRKTANQMRERLADILGADTANRVVVGTFHGFGLTLIRQNLATFGLRQGFNILDESDAKTLVNRILDDNDGVLKRYIKHRKVTPSMLLKEINYRINRLQPFYRFEENLAKPHDAEALLDLHENKKNPKDREPLFGYFFRRYQIEKHGNNVLDFNDLLYLPLLALSRNAAFADKVTGLFDRILIDEFQDSNVLQYRLVGAVSGRGRVPVTIVGDDDQSIYSFLGAVEHGMQHFIEDYPGVEVFKLEQNYRSSAQIIAASNKLISHNRKRIDKTLFTDNPPGEQPVHQHLRSDHDEARLVVDKIESLLSAGTPHHEIAVLYRNNAFNRTFEKELAHRGIPYRIVGDVSFYKRTEINLVMGYMKAALNPENQIDLVKVLKFARIGVGDKKIDDARTYMTEHNVGFREALIETLPTRLTELLTERVFGPLERIARDDEDLQATVSESIRAIYEVFDLKKLVVEAYKSKPGNEDAEVDAKAERRAVNMEELFDAAVRFETTYRDASGQIAAPMLQDFLDYCIISADLSQHEESRVNLMTLHKAKGLEFDHVFLPCFDDSIMPGRDALGLDDDPDDEMLENMEEARRLAYVGLTRARQGLYLYSAANRWVNGETRSGDPSRFLAEMAPVVRVALQGFEMQPRSVLAQHPMTAKPGQGSAEPTFDYEIPFDLTANPVPPEETRPESVHPAGSGSVIARLLARTDPASQIPAKPAAVKPAAGPPPGFANPVPPEETRPESVHPAGSGSVIARLLGQSGSASQVPVPPAAVKPAAVPPPGLFTNTILPPPRRPKHG